MKQGTELKMKLSHKSSKKYRKILNNINFQYFILIDKAKRRWRKKFIISWSSITSGKVLISIISSQNYVNNPPIHAYLLLVSLLSVLLVSCRSIKMKSLFFLFLFLLWTELSEKTCHQSKKFHSLSIFFSLVFYSQKHTVRMIKCMFFLRIIRKIKDGKSSITLRSFLRGKIFFWVQKETAKMRFWFSTCIAYRREKKIRRMKLACLWERKQMHSYFM